MLTTQNVLILILCISDLFLIAFNMPLTLIEVLRFYWHTSFLGMVRAHIDSNISSVANRLIGEVVQSRRRPLLRAFS